MRSVLHLPVYVSSFTTVRLDMQVCRGLRHQINEVSRTQRMGSLCTQDTALCGLFFFSVRVSINGKINTLPAQQTHLRQLDVTRQDSSR